MKKTYHKGDLSDYVIKRNEIAIVQSIGGQTGQNISVSDIKTGKLLYDINYRPNIKNYVFRTLKNCLFVSATIAAVVGISKIYEKPVSLDFLINALLYGNAASIGISLGFEIKNECKKRFNELLAYYYFRFPAVD